MNFINLVLFQKLPLTRINEAAELIYNTYQAEGIWLNYTEEEAIKELICSFTNEIYKPTYFIAIYENKVIGIASYMWSHTSGNIFELSFNTVHPKFQRKGIGQRLIDIRLKEIIEKTSSDAVIVTTTRVPKMFEKYNFKKSFNVKNEDEESEYMYCNVVDLPNYDSIKNPPQIKTNKRHFH